MSVSTSGPAQYKVDSHIATILKMADELKWAVTTNNTVAVITRPDRRHNATIELPLNPTHNEWDEVQRRTRQLGIAHAYTEWQKQQEKAKDVARLDAAVAEYAHLIDEPEQTPDDEQPTVALPAPRAVEQEEKAAEMPTTQPAPVEPVREPKGAEDSLSCPYCDFVAKAPQGRGSHLWRSHGVRGSSRSATPVPKQAAAKHAEPKQAAAKKVEPKQAAVVERAADPAEAAMQALQRAHDEAVKAVTQALATGGNVEEVEALQAELRESETKVKAAERKVDKLREEIRELRTFKQGVRGAVLGSGNMAKVVAKIVMLDPDYFDTSIKRSNR